MKYSGKLGKQRPYRTPPGPLATDEQQDAWVRSEIDDEWAIVRELFVHYGCEIGDWRELAWALMQDHVPAISRARAPSGRKPVWDDVNRAELVLAIDELRERNSSLSIVGAAGRLCRKEPWRKLLSAQKNPADALRKQYEKADHRWVDMTRKARLYRQWDLSSGRTLADIARSMNSTDAGKNGENN